VGTLTKKQIDFSVHYAESRNSYQSAISAGYSKSFAKSRSHELLKNPDIIEQIETLSDRYYKEQFKELALTSIKELSDIVTDSENRPTQLKAIQYILNEAGIAGQPDSQAGTIEVKIRLPDDLQH